MITCGFLDHNLNNIHATLAVKLLHGELNELGVRVLCAYESSPDGRVDWCAVNDIQRSGSAEEVVDRCDVVWVLDPEARDHLGLGRPAFQSGKRVFVDKYLANTFDDAVEIVSLCDAHGTALLSSSAVRFAVELDAALEGLTSAPTSMYARGPGAWPVYACHTIAPLLRVMGCGIERMINTGSPDVDVISVAFDDGHSGLLEVRYGENVQRDFQWECGIKTTGLTRFKIVDGKSFFRNLVHHVATWFNTGESDITVDEMLAVVWILDRARSSLAAGGVWIPGAGKREAGRSA